MKALTKYIILLSILGNIASCKKDKYKTVINGQIQDATNFKPVPNATVYLQRKNLDCFSCNPSTFLTLTADADGKFSYTFDAEKGYSHSVAAEANDYFSNVSTGGKIIEEGEKNTIAVYIQPKGWLKLHIKNTQPVDPNDKIAINGDFDSPQQFYGVNIDTFMVVTIYGNTSVNVYSEVTKNAFSKKYSYLVHCSSFDTTNYSINY